MSSETDRKAAEAELAQAEKNLRVATFLAPITQAAVEQAKAMGSTGPIVLEGTFEGEPFYSYLEISPVQNGEHTE
jgi:hypothetical protein